MLRCLIVVLLCFSVMNISFALPGFSRKVVLLQSEANVLIGNAIKKSNERIEKGEADSDFKKISKYLKVGDQKLSLNKLVYVADRKKIIVSGHDEKGMSYSHDFSLWIPLEQKAKEHRIIFNGITFYSKDLQDFGAISKKVKLMLEVKKSLPERVFNAIFPPAHAEFVTIMAIVIALATVVLMLLGIALFAFATAVFMGMVWQKYEQLDF